MAKLIDIMKQSSRKLVHENILNTSGLRGLFDGCLHAIAHVQHEFLRFVN
jgi:hypothetical protein